MSKRIGVPKFITWLDFFFLLGLQLIEAVEVG